MKVFVSPHNDDEALFGAFTIQREKPLVIIVFDSVVQVQRGHAACDAVTRREESLRALEELGTPRSMVRFCGLGDHGTYSVGVVADAIKRQIGGASEYAWVPAPLAGGHAQHNLVGDACLSLGWPRPRLYATYTGSGKTRTDNPVLVESGDWIKRKLRALACYETQYSIEALGCRPHFMELDEYYL